MNQLETAYPSDVILFDDYSARTDSAFWANAFPKQPIIRWLQTSTALNVPGVSVKKELQALFTREFDESSENVESEFLIDLRAIVLKWGEQAVDALAGILFYERINKELASEALALLARMEDKSSYHRRLWLLESGLFSNTAQIRDAASLGLALLDDPQAIPYLRKAIEEENCEELRDDLKQILEQLQETLACR
jgi:HEAT repeat protein